MQKGGVVLEARCGAAIRTSTRLEQIAEKLLVAIISKIVFEWTYFAMIS